MDVAAWLRRLGLEQYAPAFRDNDVDSEVLPQLTADDLISIGVTSVGHRRKLLAAITSLGTQSTTDAQLVASVPPALTFPPTTDAERRQLTVMFCDLVGSTALSTRHDPEDLRELIGDYHRAVADTVGRFDGFVAKYMGDGVLIYFGYPRAHEDDAERAVRAGIAVIAAVAGLDIPDRLAVRLGVASGLVVVGDLIGEGAAQERGVIGETPNLAARLQGLAEPNTIVIADATRRQFGGLFDADDLGPQSLAGFAEPQRAWRVLGESGVVSRFEALRSGATPLVGRDEELDLVMRRWVQAKTGEGRVVLISGEPGIGKSRIAAAVTEHIAGEPHTRLRYFCSPHHQDSALHPFIAQLERAANLTREDTADQKRAKIDALLAPSAWDPNEVTLIAELLSLPNDAAGLNLSPQRKREMLLEGLLRQLAAIAGRNPVLMVFEDAQWIDPSSRELVDLTIERVRLLPVLLVITCRPEFRPSWGDRPHVATLALNRLGGRDGTALVQNLAGNAALDAALVAEIVERTDGVPLFVEELTKAVLESADGENRVAAVLAASPLSKIEIPATLHASLIARLDRLGTPAKEVAQIGAVLGREFTYELIDHVARRHDLDTTLGKLTDAGLLLSRGVPPHASYLFKHTLVQDAAYATLLRARRQELHARVAAVLNAHFTDLVERQPELLAHHFTTAGDADRGIEYWFKAGERAAKQSANREAISHLRSALRMVEALSDPARRPDWELRILIALGPALMTTTSSASPEVVEVYERARQLAGEAGEGVQFFQTLFGSWMVTVAASDLGGAGAIAEELLTLAQQQGNLELVLQGHHAAWSTSFLKGDLRAAYRDACAGTPLYRRDEHQHHAMLYGGHDPGVCGHGMSAMVGALLGNVDQAVIEASATLNLGRSLSHHGSLAHAYWLASEAHYLRRDAEAVCKIAAEMVPFSVEHGSPLSIANAMIFRGWGLIAVGRQKEGLDDLRDGLARWRQTGSKFNGPYRLARVADSLLLGERLEEALAVLAEAGRLARETGEYWSDPEIDRLLGIGKLRQSGWETGAPDAERSLLRALEGARDNGLRLFELRAATSLARLWGKQGRRAEARDLLAPIYGWFTEGFDTADLKEARVLLEELA